MAKNSILGINYTAPHYHLIEVSSIDVPVRACSGDRVRVQSQINL